MKAQEFYNELEEEFIKGSPNSKLNKKVRTTKELVLHALNAFAAYKIEEVREKAKAKAGYTPDPSGDTWGDFGLDDLNNIFDETLNDLK